jgi:hypothetical protein
LFKRFIKSPADDPFSEKLKKAGFDEVKYKISQEIISGIENCILFQKYPDYEWPHWVLTSTDSSSEYNTGSILPHLVNSSYREEVPFSNFFSPVKIYLDPSGLIFSADQPWSIELLIKIKDKVIRPCDDPAGYKIFKSSENGIAGVDWKNEFFSLNLSLFGVDNPCAQISFSELNVKNINLSICIRPYNNRRLGGIHSIDYDRQTGIVSINGEDSLFAETAPAAVNSVSASDKADYTDGSHAGKYSVSDPEGTAGIEFEYNVKDISFSTAFSIRITDNFKPVQGSLVPASLKENFSGFTSSFLSRGFTVSAPDRIFTDWIKTLKMNITGEIFNIGMINGLSDFRSLRKIYYNSAACHRIGLIDESKKLLTSIGERLASDNRKAVSFCEVQGASYYLSAVADLFTHHRDADYLKDVFPGLRKHAEIIYNYFTSVKSVRDIAVNTLPVNFISRGEAADLIPAAAAAASYSYLARNIGIFGEEIKYSKLSESIQQMITGYFDSGKFSIFDYNCLYGAFPFHLKSFGIEKLKVLLKKTLNRFGDNSLVVPGAGVDSAGLIVLSCNMMLLGMHHGLDNLYEIMKKWNGSFTIPEFTSFSTGRGIYCGETSGILSPLMFLVLRNMLFNDSDDILELFPCPSESWFKSGRKVIIKNAPSRYGLINISAVSGQSEINIHFDELPKFVPPSISITLPFKTAIIESDDFIIKKTEGAKHFINGWPSIVRLIRK